jgi:predicted alpha/beta-fold hydrolase
LIYCAPRWLPGAHAQTIWPLAIKGDLPSYRRERWTTPDDDFIDLDWVEPVIEPANSIGTPLVCLFHGLEGSSRSHYSRRLMQAVARRGWRGVVVHFRGCSGQGNLQPRAYHSGDSAEIDWILRRLAGSGVAPLCAVGVSLGGNALLKWLAEQGDEASRVLAAAAAVSAPLDLAVASLTLARGFNRIYTRHFLKSLLPRARAIGKRHPGRIDLTALSGIANLAQYDEVVTAPLHGFRDAADYYARSSAGPLLRAIRTPVLVLNARNDPFMPDAVLPAPTTLPDSVRAEFPAHGGHVGFVHGPAPGHLDWLPQRLLAWFDTCLPSPRRHRPEHASRMA